MQRERNESVGDLNVVNIVFSYGNTPKILQISTGLGYYKLPDVKNYRLNKYGLLSHTQLNVSAKYCLCRVGKIIVKLLCFCRKIRTTLLRIVANSDDIIERHIKIF